MTALKKNFLKIIDDKIREETKWLSTLKGGSWFWRFFWSTDIEHTEIRIKLLEELKES